MTRLRDGNTLPSSTNYLTLSHCWGREPIFTLLRSNFESFYQNIDRVKLPKTFQDALWMTRRLGFKYLWIDSLCIIQDSYNDWLKEAPQMGEVYRNATSNLATTGFSDGRKGLFSTRESKLLVPLKVYADWDGTLGDDDKTQLRGQYYLVDENLWEDGVSNAPLNRRAWVVQERILSPRIIHFGAQQLFWECYETKGSEAFPNGLQNVVWIGNELKNKYFKDTQSFRAPGTSSWQRPNAQLPSQLCSKIPDRRQDLYSFWRDVVEAYSNSHLTFGQDKLPAISGIVKELSLSLKERYIAGLWEGDLIHSLLWLVRESDDFYGLPSEYRAPTWSWASVDAKISWYASVRTRPSYLSRDPGDHPPEVVHSSIVDVTSATFINDDNEQLTIHWSLQIKGPLRRAVKIPFLGKHMDFGSWEINGKKIKLFVSQDTNPGFKKHIIKPYTSPSLGFITGAPFIRGSQLSSLSRELDEVDEMFVLPILSNWDSYFYIQFEIYGLILCPTGRKRGEFYRIGTFKIGDLDSQKVVLQYVDAYEETFFEGVDSAGNYTITIV
jgi:hypothetical protein